MPFRFRIRWTALTATIVVATLGVMLGQWQTRRGDEKQALQTILTARRSAPAIVLTNTAGLDLAQNEFRRVTLRGHFVAGWPMYLDNRPYQGVSGFYLLMPFTISGTQTAVIVERGWVPRDANDRVRMPDVPTPPGEVEIKGIVRSSAGHLLQLGATQTPHPGVIMQNLDIDAVARVSKLPLAPFVIEQSGELSGDPRDGLVRDWPSPSLGIERHRGYAVQWYALALMAVIFFVVTGRRSGKKQTAR